MSSRHNRSPARDRRCCSANLLKYLLFILTFLYYAAGLGLLVLATYTFVAQLRFAVLLPDQSYVVLTYIVLAIGLLLLLTGLFGCAAVFRLSRGCLLALAISAGLLFVAQIVCGFSIFVFAEGLPDELSLSLHRTMVERYEGEEEVHSAVDILQKEFGCCGASNYSDWRGSQWFASSNTPEMRRGRDGATLHVPESCCRSASTAFNCALRAHPSNIHYDGCAIPLALDIAQYAYVYGAVVLLLALVQLCTMLVACCLYGRLPPSEHKLEGEAEARRQQRQMHSFHQN